MTTPRNTILTGDAADRLATLEASRDRKSVV